MKKGLLTLLLLIITALPALAAPTNTTGPWGIDAGGFKNLSSALTAPGYSGKTFVISKPMTINNKTLPETRHIKIIGGGSITPAAGKTFDFNGQTPEAGNHQVFGEAGLITNLGNGNAKWFGAAGTGTADDTVSIDKLVAAVVSGGTLNFPKTKNGYGIGDLATITKPLTFDFNNSKIIPKGTGIMFNILFPGDTPNETPDSVVIKNGNVYPGTSPSNIIKNSFSFNTLIDNFNMQNVTATHSLIWSWKQFGMRITNSKFRGCASPKAIFYDFVDPELFTAWSTSTSMDNCDISSHTGVGIYLVGGFPINISHCSLQYISGGAIQHANDISSVWALLNVNHTYFEGNLFDISMGGGVNNGGNYSVDNNHFGPIPPGGSYDRVLMSSGALVSTKNNNFLNSGGFGGVPPASYVGINNFTGYANAPGYTGVWDKELSDTVRGGTRKTIINKITDLVTATVTAGNNTNIVASQPLSGTAYDEWKIVASNNFGTGITEIFKVVVNKQDAAITGVITIDLQESEILTLNVAPVVPWSVGDSIRGITSTATFEISRIQSPLIYGIKKRNKPFSAAESMYNEHLASYTAQTGAYPTVETATGAPHSAISVVDNANNTYSIKATNLGSLSNTYRTTYVGNSRLY